MGIKVRAVIWCMGPLLSVASLAAPGSDLRVVEAAKNKDEEAVRSLLKQRVDVNTPEGDGATALLWAAHWDDLETADLLIRAGASVNAANNHGDTPLWEACNNGSAAMVEKLAKAGADPNAIIPGTGETALMTCVNTGNAEVVKTLLAHGADVNAKEHQKGQTALMWAIEGRYPEIARVLIEHGADVHAKSKGGFTPLLFAARQGDLASGRMLVERGADVNEKAPWQRFSGNSGEFTVVPEASTPLLVAADSGREAFAIFLVEQGADVNAADPDGYTALHCALRKGRSILLFKRTGGGYFFRPNMSKLVNTLLEHGANPNAPVVKGIRMDMESAGGRPQIALAGVTPLVLAAATGDVAIMKGLLAKGADANLATNDNVTALMAAAGVGRKDPYRKDEAEKALEAVKLLVELGADVNATSIRGQTALHGATFTKADDIIQFLVDKGAKLDAEDRVGQTPLSIADGDPNDFVDSSEKSTSADPTTSTAKLIRKLGGNALAEVSDLALEKTSR